MAAKPEDVARRFTEAYAAEDWDQTFELLDDEHVLEVDERSPEAGVYHGHDGVRRYFRRWLGTWTDRSWEIVRVEPAGDDVVIVGIEHMRGKGSGIELSRRSAVVHTVRDGKVVRSRIVLDSEEALRQYGLA